MKVNKIADLYVRVSTDEQADKGYSQRNQEEVLRKFCMINDITIREVIYEDHSAKSFNRPAWKKLLLLLKKQKHKTDLVLFTKWDRFSRNAGDAYQMISILRKVGVEPQAIEQPLDLSIPENKMMLAFYLAAPEVENDRRALNVLYGMRRAMKEGRYVSQAPIGYVNKSKEDGRKYIAPKEPQASIIKWAFEEIAKGIFNTEEILRMARKKGLTVGKNAFWLAIRNPLYCGKIFVPKFKDEESQLVKGQHEAIITEDLYYTVQDVLDGRSRSYRPKMQIDADFPLRGFLRCPKCLKILTASKSKGRSRYYSYYHCFGGCTHRLRAEPVNEKFKLELDKFMPRPEIKELYVELIVEAYNEQTKGSQDEKKRILAQLKDYEARLSHARDLLATRKIDADDYREMKSDYSSMITKLEVKLGSLNNEDDDIEELLRKGIDRLLNLRMLFDTGKLEDTRGLIGSIYPENFSFEENEFRTSRINEAVSLIYLINKEIDKHKKRTKSKKPSLSFMVGDEGFEPPTLSV